MNTNSLELMGVSKERAQLMVDVQIKFQQDLHRRGVWQSCVNCSNYNPGSGRRLEGVGIGPRCDLVGKLPPPEVIVFGCEKHEADIPF